jgi:aminomuconate-semialdehyde/2-hydroxymuconate-6-semialdehyde dehydrogenase
MMVQIDNMIGGEFVAGVSGARFPRHSPSTNAVIAEVPDSGILDVAKAVQAANKSLAAWLRTEASERGRYLAKMADLMEARLEEFARLQSEDTGDPIRWTKAHSLPRAISCLRYFAEFGVRPPESTAGVIQNRLPIGVVAVLTPWCEPFASLASRVAPAIMAGNAVIAKPSEFAPRCADAFARIALEAGLPSGVFNLVQGRGAEAGASLVRHPGLSTLSFMGSTDTGREVQRDASELLKRTQLALGARNPLLVFAEANLPETMPRIARLALCFGGSTCLRGSRIFVQDKIYDAFLASFKAEAESLSVGDPLNEKTEIGPLVSNGLVDRYSAAIAQSTKENGRLLFGGAGLPEGLHPSLQAGAFAKPTAFYDLTLCSTLQQEEVVGPFVTIASFKYQHDAVKHANNSPLGQAAYIFHGDPEKAMKVASKVEAGRIFVGTGPSIDEDRFPHGGIKTSGLGREGGEASLGFFSRETAIVTGAGR